MVIENNLRTLSIESEKRVKDISRSRRAFARGGVSLDPATVEAEDRARLGVELAGKLRRENRAEDVAFRGSQQAETVRANRASEALNLRRIEEGSAQAHRARRQQEEIAQSQLSLGQRISNRVVKLFLSFF